MAQLDANRSGCRGRRAGPAAPVPDARRRRAPRAAPRAAQRLDVELVVQPLPARLARAARLERGLRRPGRQALSTEAAEYNPAQYFEVIVCGTDDGLSLIHI